MDNSKLKKARIAASRKARKQLQPVLVEIRDLFYEMTGQGCSLQEISPVLISLVSEKEKEYRREKDRLSLTDVSYLQQLNQLQKDLEA